MRLREVQWGIMCIFAMMVIHHSMAWCDEGSKGFRTFFSGPPQPIRIKNGSSRLVCNLGFYLHQYVCLKMTLHKWLSKSQAHLIQNKLTLGSISCYFYWIEWWSKSTSGGHEGMLFLILAWQDLESQAPPICNELA